jgi:hypothetical protein
MAVMLVKKRSVDELVARIQRGKVIPKEKVVNESELRCVLVARHDSYGMNSANASERSRHYRGRQCDESQGPSLVRANSGADSIRCVFASSMLRCSIFSPASGTSAAMVMSDMQQDRLLRRSCRGQVR